MTTTVRIVCGICDENTNRSNHATLTCPFCSFEACRSCCETYILGQPNAKCMNTACGKEWTRKFLGSAFSKTFLNTTWRKCREKVLLDKELALLPATQAVVEQQIHKEKVQAEIDEVEVLIRQLEIRKNNLKIERNGGTVNTRNVRNFIRACPDSECRGFLSSQWKCGLCEQHTCPDCHVVIGLNRSVEHVCNPDELATAQLLDKDTKPCPKCSTGIFKIEGCDQMWCTQCHTAFDWRSGMIETRVHNPHFFEWQRKNGNGEIPRAPGDVICGRELDHTFVPRLVRPFLSKVNSEQDKAATDEVLKYSNDIVRSVLHLQQVDMPKYRVDEVENNLDLRVAYMRKKIDKDTFSSRIHRDNKKYEKHHEMHQVLQMFVQTVTDILFRFASRLRSVGGGNIFIMANFGMLKREMEGIVTYANECLEEIANTFEHKKKTIVLPMLPIGGGTGSAIGYRNHILV
jgi:hypothetical protein